MELKKELNRGVTALYIMWTILCVLAGVILVPTGVGTLLAAAGCLAISLEIGASKDMEERRLHQMMIEAGCPCAVYCS